MLRRRIALLLPGQGSQHVGMSRELCAQEPAARHAVQEVEEALQLPLLHTLMHSGPADELTRTHNCQPAILAHSLAVWRTLQAHTHGAAAAHVAAALGHSLGEFSALVCADALALRDAARIVRKRGEAMQAAVDAQAVPTRMVAVVLKPQHLAALEAIVRRRHGEGVAIANYNSSTQVTLSGTQGAVDAAAQEAREAGVILRAMPLAVSAPFHTPLMQSAADVVRDELTHIRMHKPRVPVYSNVTGEQLPNDVDAIKAMLVQQTTASVLWHQSVKRCVHDHPAITHLIEIGPGSVLRNIAAKEFPSLTSLSVEKPADLTAALALLSSLH